MAWSTLGVFGRFLSSSILFGFVWSCAGSDSNDDLSRLDWKCLEFSSGCSCEASKPNVEHAGSHPVDVCDSAGCCLLSEQEDVYSYASCECFEGDAASCEAEAASRRATKVVESCPPGAAPPACAALAENCRPEYLEDNGLSCCCEGSICMPNAAGVPVCQAG